MRYCQPCHFVPLLSCLPTQPHVAMCTSCCLCLTVPDCAWLPDGHEECGHRRIRGALWCAGKHHVVSRHLLSLLPWSKAWCSLCVCCQPGRCALHSLLTKPVIMAGCHNPAVALPHWKPCCCRPQQNTLGWAATWSEQHHFGTPAPDQPVPSAPCSLPCATHTLLH